MNHFPVCSGDATTNNYVQLTSQGENDSQTARGVLLSQVEPAIVSDGRENDLRPSSSPPSNSPITFTSYTRCNRTKLRVAKLVGGWVSRGLCRT